MLIKYLISYFIILPLQYFCSHHFIPLLLLKPIYLELSKILMKLRTILPQIDFFFLFYQSYVLKTIIHQSNSRRFNGWIIFFFNHNSFKSLLICFIWCNDTHHFTNQLLRMWIFVFFISSWTFVLCISYPIIEQIFRVDVSFHLTWSCYS